MSIEDQEKALSEIVCKNCQNHFHGSYCNLCGQKVINKRNTVKHFFDLIFDSFDVKRGVLYTCKLLFIKPGKLVNEYLDGRTKDYYNPLRYLVIITGLFAIFMIWFDVFDMNIETANELLGTGQEKTKLQSKILGYTERYLNIFPILILPFCALISKWIFKKYKLYYAEHLIINSFLFAQNLLIQILIIFVILFIPGLSTLFLYTGVVVFILYYTYALQGVFKIKLLKSFFSSTTIFVLGVLSFWLSLIIIAIISIIILMMFGVNLKELVQ